VTDKPLTEKQRAFVAAYVGEAKGNGTHAARLAGYEGDDKTLAVTASRLLGNAKVAAALDVFRMATAKASIMDAQEAAETLTTIARGEATDRRIVGGKDDFVEADLPVQCHVRVEAVKALSKMRGYDAAQRTELSGTIGVVSLTPEQDEALSEWLRLREDPVIAARIAELAETDA
jgi:phage terminase small subunit